MSGSKSLWELIALARRQMPEVPGSVWEHVMRLAIERYPATRLYVPSQKKKRNLDVLAAREAPSTEIAKQLGVSVRRVQQLKQLR